VEPDPDEEAEQLEGLEAEAEGAVAEVAPEVQDYGLHDERWSTDDWRGLLDKLIALGLVTWKEIVVLALGQMNPPQVGTAIASSKSFQANFDRAAGESLMSAVMRWFYAEAGTCADCGTRLDLQADHVDPRQNYEYPGEADRLDNLTLRCRRCNVIRRPSHVFGGVTHLSAEAALMWILLVIRPRTLLDFVRLCRLYGMTMADVRMQEAWAMAQWLSRDDHVEYEIEDDSAGRYDIEVWPDGAVTRRRTGGDPPHGESRVLYSGVFGDAVFAFVSRDEAGAYRFHEVPISVLPFSTYDLGDRPPSALAVLPTPPDRSTGVMARLRFLPPRGLELVSFTIRSSTQTSRVEYLDGRGHHRTSDGPTSPRGRALSPAPHSAISMITI
jgi:5-methylcytosine-specific restriction endonuclease McrA